MIKETHRKKYVLARRIDDARCMAMVTPFALLAALIAAVFDDKEYLLVCLVTTIITALINLYLTLRIEGQISRNITEAEKIGDIIEF